MAKKDASAPVGKRRGSRAITVFNVIFIVLAVIAIVVAVLMFTPVSKSLKSFLQGQQWAIALQPKFVDWVKYHLVNNLGLTMPFRGHGVTFTACLYVYAYSLLLFGLLFLMYTPFLVMNHNRKLGRKGGFRKALCWIVFIVTFLVFLGYLSVPYTQKITSLVGPYYKWFPDTYTIWKNLFANGQILSKLRLSFISNNLWFNATFYILVLLVLFQIIFYVMACKIKGKERIAEPEEKAEEVKEEIVEETVPVIAPVAAAEVKEEKPAVETVRVAPTIRELALLNSLEPIEASPISNLPGLYDTEVEKLIDLLEPQINEALAREDYASPDAIEARRLSETIQPNLVRSIQVLPGIDEWGATPWADELENSIKPKDYTVKILPGIDEWKADPFAEEIVESEKVEEAPVPEPVEVKPVVEEKPEEAPIAEEASEVNEITDIVAPQEETVPVVEEVKEEIVEEVVEEAKPEEVEEEKTSRLDQKVVLTDNSHEEVKTEKFYKDNEWVVPDYHPEDDVKEEPVVKEVKEEEPTVEEAPKGPVTKAICFLEKGGKRPQEEEHEPVAKESGESRLDKKVVALNNEHTEIKTDKFHKENKWILPEYVPEPKPEPVEEKKPELVKPIANVKQVELKQAPIAKPENKPKIVPIAPITPKPEPVVEEKTAEEEKKVLTPIAGPLHSTAKSKHEKIEAIKAQKVRFELRNYQIKTFEGDISAEEAFRKGVTKVQPTVNPVFANQSDEPAWKQKRRNEEIRKNGYTNVTTVDKLNGNVPSVQNTNKPKSPLSIRELVKAQKAETAKPEAEEKKEEKKIEKPITPIAIKPQEPAKPVEGNDKLKAQNPFSDKPVPAFHPIAPINKKPNNRPTIKPVDPLKKK